MPELPYTKNIIDKICEAIKKGLEMKNPELCSADFLAGFNFARDIAAKKIDETKTDLLK